MEQKSMLKLAVIISITGIVLLFILSKFIKIEPIHITDIEDTYVGKTVLINGTLTKVSVSNRTLLYLDNSTIPLVIFSKVELDKNKHVLITGRVDEYQEGIQIIVDKIEII